MWRRAVWLSVLSLSTVSLSLSAQDPTRARSATPIVEDKALATPAVPTTTVIVSDALTPRTTSGWNVGAGVYYVRPGWDNAIGLTTTTTTGTAASTTISESNQNLDFGTHFAPKVWLGYTLDDGRIIRASWWRLNSGSSTLFGVVPEGSGAARTRLVVPNLAAASDDVLTAGFGVPRQGVLVVDSPAPGLGNATASVFGHLELMVADLEFAKQIQLNDWSFVVGGGARYARINQTLTGNTFSPSAAGGITQNLQLENYFTGVGPEMLLEARRSVTQNFGVYGNVRGGILFGNNKLNSEQSVIVTGAGGVITNNLTLSRHSDALASRPFAEIEAGIDLNSNSGPFLRLGFTAQQWFNAGSPTSSTNNKTGDLNLFGLILTAGFSF